MAKVRVDSTDQVFDAKEGEDLLEVLQANGFPIATSCGGIASCGLCRLTVVCGRELLSPIKPQEIHHLGTVAKVLGLRLACQSRIAADGEIVVRVPLVDDVEERKLRKVERLRVERRRESGPPSSRSAGSAASQAPAVTRGKIEWRPRVLAATPSGAPEVARVAGEAPTPPSTSPGAVTTPTEESSATKTDPSDGAGSR